MASLSYNWTYSSRASFHRCLSNDLMPMTQMRVSNFLLFRREIRTWAWFCTACSETCGGERLHTTSIFVFRAVPKYWYRYRLRAAEAPMLAMFLLWALLTNILNVPVVISQASLLIECVKVNVKFEGHDCQAHQTMTLMLILTFDAWLPNTGLSGVDFFVDSINLVGVSNSMQSLEPPQAVTKLGFLWPAHARHRYFETEYHFYRFRASPCSGPGTGHLRRRGLGQTDKNRGDVQLQIVVAILIVLLRNFTSLFFIC